jgi:hypothetical protein
MKLPVSRHSLSLLGGTGAIRHPHHDWNAEFKPHRHPNSEQTVKRSVVRRVALEAV